MKRKTEVRICAICGKPGADLGFRTALRWLGVENWQIDKAHIACVRNLQARQLPQADGDCHSHR